MIRVVLYLIALIALSSAVAWFSGTPGQVDILWKDYRITTTAAFLLLLTVLAGAVIAFLFWLWRFTVTVPRKLRRHRQQVAYMRGLQAVTQTLTAIASGDTAHAKSLSGRVRKHLRSAPITYLLDAQLARLENDETGVHRALESMLEFPETRALAAKSLAEYNARSGNLPKAQALATRAQALDSKNPDVCRTLFSVHIQARQWQEAEMTANKCLWQRSIAARTARRWKGIMHLARADALATQGDTGAAMLAAQLSWKRLPHFVPAALRYVELLRLRGEDSKALKILKRSWAEQPHPLLTEALRTFYAGKTTEDFFKTAKKFSALHADHPESRLLLAYAYERRQDWQQARQEVKEALARQESARLLNAMAEIEENGFQDRAAAARWLVQASKAAPEETWICTSCGALAERWQANCGACHAFDTLEWKSPTLHPPAAIPLRGVQSNG